MGFGAGNRLQMHLITDGAPDTITTTPDVVMDQTFSSAWDKLLKLGAALTLDQDKYDPDITTFLVDAVPETPPPDAATAAKYEDGAETQQSSGVTSYTGNRYVFVWYGGLDPTGATRNIRTGVCYVGQESGALTTAWEQATKPSFVIKGMKAETAIALAAGLWSTGLVTPAGASPAPTSIPISTYGVETWVTAP